MPHTTRDWVGLQWLESPEKLVEIQSKKLKTSEQAGPIVQFQSKLKACNPHRELLVQICVQRLENLESDVCWQGSSKNSPPPHELPSSTFYSIWAQTYWMVLPTFRVGLPHSVGWHTDQSPLRTPSQTYPEGFFINFPGIS